LAKGITGGYLPLAATLTTERVFEAFSKPEHTFYYGHSYTANQLGCAAALASLRVFEEEQVLAGLPAKVAAFGRVLDELRAEAKVGEVRQCGLIAGIDIVSDAIVGPHLCVLARAHGLLTRAIGNTLVLMPPLCSKEDELQRMGRALTDALREFEQRN
jgi:adenosylmethionine-8-amino-7-oxononanoate aminotransferase